MARIKRPKKIGYKILSRLLYSRNLHSCYELISTIRYDEKKRTYKMLCNGPLAVFDTIENALWFTSNNDLHMSRVIWKCEYRESIHKNLWRYGITHFDGTITRERMEPFLGELPTGTRLADNVKLLERVE